MKRIFHACACLALTLSILYGCAPQNGYEIKGDLENFKGKVYLLADMQVIDSTETDNGKFTFSGPIEHPLVGYIGTGDRTIAFFMLENGKITLTGNAAGKSPIMGRGSKANEAYFEYEEDIKDLFEKYDDNTRNDLGEMLTELNDLILRTVAENRDNIAGVVIFLNGIVPKAEPEEIIASIEQFSEDMQRHPYLQEARKMAESRLGVASDDTYIPITLPDRNGTQHSVSDLLAEGKHVLVDFWASWCGPCLGQIPHLKTLYEKYRNKGLEIYSISLDRDMGEWLGALDRYEMAWINVSGAGSSVDSDYAIQFIPATLLISPDGKILGRNLSPEKLDETLEEIL